MQPGSRSRSAVRRSKSSGRSPGDAWGLVDLNGPGRVALVAVLTLVVGAGCDSVAPSAGDGTNAAPTGRPPLDQGAAETPAEGGTGAGPDRTNPGDGSRPGPDVGVGTDTPTVEPPQREYPDAPTKAELAVPLLIEEPAGLDRTAAPVTVGVPLPHSAGITDIDVLGIFDGETELPAQFRVLSRWGGGVEAESQPIRWVLADFQVDLAAGGTRTVYLADVGSGTAVGGSMSVDLGDPARAVVETGAMTAVLSREFGHVFEQVTVDGQVIADDPTADRSRSGVTLADGDGTVYRAAWAANPEFVVEEQGPLRTTIRITSELAAANGTVLRPGAVRVMQRIDFYAGQPFVRVRCQLENNAPYGSFDWDDNSPDPANVLDFDALTFDLPLALTGKRTMRSDGYVAEGTDADTWRVYQGHVINDPMDESVNFFFETTRDGVVGATGDRHAGWIDVRGPAAGVTAGVRWFWQNYEKALGVAADRLSIELWPAEGYHPPDRTPADLYQFEGGRHKGHEMFLAFAGASGDEPSEISGRFEAPLIARAPARWYYQTMAMGLTEPGDLVFSGTDDDTRMNAAYDRYNDLMRKRADGIAPDAGRESPRNLIEAKEQRYVYGWYDPCCWSAVDWYGWVHFGDAAWGDGYSSNHYDMPGFLMIHFLRTGDRALWDLAEPHVRQASEWGQVWGIDPNVYVAPISFYEKTQHGLEPERYRPAASHNWLRRLVLYYWLTGDRTAYDAALFNAEGLWRYFYEGWDVTDPTSFDFGPNDWSPLTESRFLSWTMENALEIYAMTGQRRWMDLAEDLARCLLYAFDQMGHIDGQWPHELGGNLMTHYGSEPLIRFHQASDNDVLRDEVLVLLRGLVDNVYQVDRVDPQGSGANYLPAAMTTDWEGGPGWEGPEDYDTIFNGFAASIYAYVGWVDGSAAYLDVAHRLWADGVYYPEYYSEYTPDPGDRFAVDYDNYDAWGWDSGTFPGSNEKVFARQTRAGIPYLWVMNRIRDAGSSGGR
ncbi:MAG: hypothetical protein GY778_25590 [bacterium]|nr:hypothetical protein [bacterium]